MHRQNVLFTIQAWAERRAWLIVAACTALYAIIFSVAAVYKYQSFWMGFDLGVHEQVLWNTIHGRIAEISPKGETHSYLGVDIIIIELLLAPFYALLPRTETMLVLQIILASSGTVPLFLIARDRSGQAAYGLLAALLYAAALPVQYAILYEFQIRTVGTVLFLWAFLFFERDQFVPFVAAGVLAIWTRTDAGFVLAALGLYALIHRRPWYWVLTPMVVGVGWVLLCLKLFIPAFREDHGFLYGFVYAWLGNTPIEMLQTLITRPGYVAEHVFTPEKMRYMLELFAPLLFLPLLRPDVLLIALPALLLNLLSPEHIHWSVRYHYQAFVIPFLLIATIYAVIDRRASGLAGAASTLDGWGSGAGKEMVKPWQREYFQPYQHSSFATLLSVGIIVLLLIATLGAQLIIRSPLIHLATRPRDAQRIAYANWLVEQVPDDASVTATSAFGSHLARRRELYFFPGNIIYPPEYAERGHYLIADLNEVPPEDMPRLHALQQSAQWRTILEENGFLLMEQATP